MIKFKTFQGTVYPWYCDHMGHMNVQYYVSMFDQAGWNIFSHLGLTMQFFKETGRGMAAIEQNIKYKKELMAGENVYIETTVEEVREKVLITKHTMFDGNSNVAAECRLVGVHLDAVKRKSVTFPDHILKKAKELAIPQETLTQS